MFSKLFETHARLVGSGPPTVAAPRAPVATPPQAVPATQAPGFEQYMPSFMDAEGVRDVVLPSTDLPTVATEMPPIFDAQAIMDGAAEAKPVRARAPAP